MNPTPNVLTMIVLMLTACGGGGGSRPPDIKFVDRLSAFDGEVLSVRMTDRDENEYTMNTADDSIAQHEYISVIPGHTGQTWLMIKPEPQHTQMAYTVVSWDNDNPTDYLAGGWWLLFPGRPDRLDPWEAEVNRAFVDGPEIDINSPPDLPVQGTATYTGLSGGLYQYIYGSNSPDLAGEYSLVEFEGPATFTADFSNQTLQGCIGCTGEIMVQQAHLSEPISNIDALQANPAGYELHFGPGPYNPDGTFEHGILSVRHSTREVTSSSGVFGGQFSNRPNSDGNPRLVTGIYQSDFREADGGRGRFTGLFNAVGEP